MLTFVKGFAYKFCFCLGLGTATYYSYGQVQKWVHSDQVKVVENVVEKHVTRENTVYDPSNAPQEFSYEQPTLAQAPSIAEEIQAVAPPVAPAEEKKEEEKKEETAEKKDENIEGEVADGMVAQQYPMAYPPQVGPVPASHTSNNEEQQTQAPASPLLPDALPSSPSNSSPTYSYGGSSPAYFLPSTGLDSNDIAALISPLKASFEDKMNFANGQLCSIRGAGLECQRRNHIAIHSLRWGMNEGLRRDVKFAIKSLGNSSLEVDFDFKIQNMSLSEETVSVTARPTEVLVHNEMRDSKNYRVIELQFADLNVHGEVLKQMQLTMVYEMTSSGLALNNASDLSFSRSQVEVLTTKWSPLAGEPTVPATPMEEAVSRHRRIPAAQGSKVFLIADELTFSMSVEKSL